MSPHAGDGGESRGVSDWWKRLAMLITLLTRYARAGGHGGSSAVDEKMTFETGR